MSNWFTRQLGGGSPPPAPPAPAYVPPPQQRYTPQPSAESPQTASDLIFSPRQRSVVGNDRCPQCGSNNYFSRAYGSLGGNDQTGAGAVIRPLGKINSTTGQTVPPAPHCFDCGHNGLFDLQGLDVDPRAVGR